MTTFTDTWNAAFEAAPANGDNVSSGAAEVRTLKVAVQERGEVDHSWAGDGDDGKHKKLTFIEQGSDPTTAAAEQAWYAKSTGLYHRGVSDGTVTLVVDDDGTPAANWVDAEGLADDAVDTAAILDDAVTTAKILDANVTTAKLASGEQMTTANVTSALSSSTTGAVGTFGLFAHATAGTLTTGGTYAGSALRWASSTSSSGSAPSGTWVCLGYDDGSGGATLFLRTV